MESVCFEDGTILHIEDIALAKLLKYVQRSGSSKEAGGVLIGKQIQDREEYYLCDISEPSRMDKRSRFSFIRSKISAQRIVDKKWHDSNGIENYLGEWHSHPENCPTPSHTDRELIQQVIKDDTNVFKKVFLIIVGKDQSLRRFTKGYYIKQPNMDCQPTEFTALSRHRAVFSWAGKGGIPICGA